MTPTIAVLGLGAMGCRWLATSRARSRSEATTSTPAAALPRGTSRRPAAPRRRQPPVPTSSCSPFATASSSPRFYGAPMAWFQS